MSSTAPERRRTRGHIRHRGSKFQVVVYTGVDPLTGRNHYLRETTDTEDKARRILNRMVSEIEERRNVQTSATLSAALDAWLRVHEADESTLRSYERYAR